jgi:protein-S-isoprenylcysteine O-methyltransferase Ste14
MWVDTVLFDAIAFGGIGFVVAGVLLATGGVVFALWGQVEFNRAGTTFDPHHIEKATALVTTGPYRLSRNPMYLGLLAVLVGFGLVLGELVSLIVGALLFVVLLTVLQIEPEERMLADKFGDAYTDYRLRVRRWI